MKDYIRDRLLSEDLAKTVQDYWHRKGYVKVRAWVEEEKRSSEYGTKLPSVFTVRSNIKFNVANIPAGMIQ